MNREILFRAQKVGTKEFVEGDLIHSENECYILVNNTITTLYKYGRTICKNGGQGVWVLNKPCFKVIQETVEIIEKL